ncbi:hypothetical protein C1H46_045811 [Malus baccata]|uniref:Uncharacterized protein n=1 Tax=Malus baccata TaxID=106549 RepID=A0A540K313_MALBA|nr:hypothetical protein C1H46_045811 [Malus baccata]
MELINNMGYDMSYSGGLWANCSNHIIFNQLQSCNEKDITLVFSFKTEFHTMNPLIIKVLLDIFSFSLTQGHSNANKIRTIALNQEESYKRTIYRS